MGMSVLTALGCMEDRQNSPSLVTLLPSVKQTRRTQGMLGLIVLWQEGGKPTIQIRFESISLGEKKSTLF